jgi:hypothetical protein
VIFNDAFTIFVKVENKKEKKEKKDKDKKKREEKKSGTLRDKAEAFVGDMVDLALDYPYAVPGTLLSLIITIYFLFRGKKSANAATPKPVENDINTSAATSREEISDADQAKTNDN